MKTNIFSSKKTSFIPLIGFLSFLMASCGSSKNSHYKDYFGSLQDDNQSTEIFTNIDRYNDYDTINRDRQDIKSDYADWGNNYTKADINIYPNSWGLSLGFGFGYPYYGWGYSNYGWGYPYYYGYSGFG